MLENGENLVISYILDVDFSPLPLIENICS